MKKGKIAVVSSIIGSIISLSGVLYYESKLIKDKQAKVDKFKCYYNMLNQWLINKQQEKSLVNYFLRNNYKKIAIYGVGEMGNRLYEEIKDSDIEIKYAIDKIEVGYLEDLEVVSPEEELDKVDAIIVSAIFAFDEIEEQLRSRIDCEIISLEDIIDEL